MKLTFIILLLSIFVGELASAEVYKWIDEKQVVHFTDDIIQIPEKYRTNTEKIGTTEDRDEIKTENDPLANKKEDSYRDRLGRGEEYWRALVGEWREKLRVSQEKVEPLRIKYNELTEKHNNSRNPAERLSLRKERDQIKNEMDRYKIQIEEAKEMLEKNIPEEAEFNKAKPEWVKQ